MSEREMIEMSIRELRKADRWRLKKRNTAAIARLRAIGMQVAAREHIDGGYGLTHGSQGNE